MKLSNIRRLMREDLQDAPNGEWLDTLLQVINQANEQETQALQQNLTFGDNLNAAFGKYRLTHGVAETIRVPESLKGRPVWVEPCGSIAVAGSTRQPVQYIDWEHVDNTDPKAPAQVKVTPYFQRTVSGAIGEYLTSSVASGSAVGPLVSGTVTNVTSKQLTAGSWHVWGVGVFSGAPTGTRILAGISTANNTVGNVGEWRTDLPTQPTVNSDIALPITGKDITITSSTTYYLNAQWTGSASAPSAYGSIHARRTVDAYSDSAPVADVVLFFSAG